MLAERTYVLAVPNSVELCCGEPDAGGMYKSVAGTASTALDEHRLIVFSVPADTKPLLRGESQCLFRFLALLKDAHTRAPVLHCG